MRPQFPTRCAGAVALALIVGASPAVPAKASAGQMARAVSAAEMAKICADRTNLQNTIADAQSLVDLLRQVVANYGFERTAAEFEAMTESLQPGLQRQTGRTVVDTVVAPSQRTTPALELAATKPGELQKKLLEMLAGKASDSLRDFLKDLQPSAPYDLRALEKYTQLVQHLPSRMGQQLRDELIALAKSPDAQQRLLGYTRTLEMINQLPAIYSMATSDNELEILWEGTMTAAGGVNPALGILAREIDWAGRNLYDAVTGRWTNFQINRLTAMTESQLADLKARTDQLAQQTRRLRDARNALSAMAPCDTTQLARSPLPSPPPEPTPPPTNPIAPAPAEKSGGGKGKWIGIAAAGTGTAGYFLWCKQQPWNSACSWLSGYDDGGDSYYYGGGGSSGGGSSGGGSSGGGGSAATQCLSTCNCVGSLSRTCSGSVQGSCGWPANPPGGGAGAVCGQGTACRVGLACVNGRCTDIGPSCR